MEKKLLLLGVLRGQDMHGYQLSHHLGHGGGMAVTLTKSNAYKLLGKMEEDGWVTHHEEREASPAEDSADEDEGQRAPMPITEATP